MRRCGKILGGMRLVVAALIPLCVATPGGAQGSRKDDVVFGPQGRPAAGATITVCTSSATGTPCSPLASLYTDATLTVSSPNPFTTDGLGNYHFYAAPGRYQVQVSGPGITTYTISDMILPSDPSSMASGNNVSAFGLTLGGNLSVAGNASVTGTLSSGVFSPSSLAVPGNASFAGPRPAVYVTAPPYNAKGDGLTDDTVAVQAAVTAVCSSTSTGGGTLYFPPAVAPGGYYRLTQTQTTVAGDSPFNRVAQVSIPASTLVRASNVVTFTPGGTPFNVAGGPASWYFSEGVTIAGATDTSFNGTWPILSTTSSTITFYQSGTTLTNTTSGGGTATTNSPVIDLSLCAKNGNAIAIDAGNSQAGTTLQFSQAPQTKLIVQTLGSSPNTAPVFLVTGSGWSIKNLSVDGYNQAVQVNNTVEYISDNVGYSTLCSGQALGGVTDNVPLAIYSTFWVDVKHGTMNPAAGCTATSPYGVIFANVNNQQVSGLQTFRDLRMSGGMELDERGSGLGSCCTMYLENVNLEGTNNISAFTYNQTGSNGHTQLTGIYMNAVNSFDCTNGKGVFQNNTSTTVQGLTIIDSAGCGGGTNPFTVQTTGTGRFQGCRLIGNYVVPLAVDGSGNPVSGCVTSFAYGDLYVSDPTDTTRLATGLSQISGLQSSSPFPNIKPSIALAKSGSANCVNLALDPGTAAGSGGILFNDCSQSGYNTQIYSSAPNTLNIAMAQALPPTSLALATVNNGSGGCGTSSLASGTYYYNANAYATSTSFPSAPAGEQSIAVNGTQCVNVTWTASGGTNVTGYYVTRATCAGCTTSGGSGKNYTSSASPFLDSGAATSSGNASAYDASMATVGQFKGNALTMPQVNGVLFVGSAPGQYAALQAAHDALPTTGGAIAVSPGYTDTETSTVNISKPNVSIYCLNAATFTSSPMTGTGVVAINHIGVGLNVTGKAFSLAGCQLNVTATSTRNNVPIIDANVQGGRIREVSVIGNAASPDNGIFFRSTGNGLGAGGWDISNVTMFDGNTWTAVVKITNSSNSTTAADFHFTDITSAATAKFTDATWVLDGTIDTVAINRAEGVNSISTGGKTFHVRNTVSTSGSGYPRWVHCSNCYFEAGGGQGVTTGTAVEIDSGKDIDYWGYIAQSQNGFNITSSLAGVNIHDVVFTTMYGTAIAVTSGFGVTVHHNTFTDIRQAAISYSGGAGILIDGNLFWDSGNSVTNTYDTISIAAATANIQVTNNSWLNQASNKPRYGINFLGSETGVVVSGNNYASATFGTAFLSPPSSGSTFEIIGQDFTVTNKFSGPVQVLAGNLGFGGNKGQHLVTQAASSDVSGTIALTSGAPSTATFTFTTAYTSAPVCVASDQTAASAIKVAPSAANVVFTGPNSVTDTIAFICAGNPN